METLGEDSESITGVEGSTGVENWSKDSNVKSEGFEQTDFDINVSEENEVGRVEKFEVTMTDVGVGDGDLKRKGNVEELFDDKDGNLGSMETGGNVESVEVNMADVIFGDGDWKGEENVGVSLEDCRFGVGDFVWAKVKSHPWWPGQVYDRRDASEFAVKHSVEGSLLVAFFGDGSCSWRLPSQLVPFVENFKEMSAVDDGMSKSFGEAIRSAVEEVGRVVESKMICKCVPLEERDGLGRLAVSNAGVKPGVLTPAVDICGLSLPDYEADGILSQLMHFARDSSIENELEYMVLKSWLSAFYRAKGGYRLTQLHEPLDIEGMEEKYERTGEVLDDKFSFPIEVPVLGSRNDSIMKSQDSSRDKVNHRRKRRSVAKLMKDNAQVKSNEKSFTIMKRKKNVEDEEDDSEEEESLLEKSIKSDVTAAKHDRGEALDESEKEYTPRERKRSKYLSPPYITLTWRTVGNSSLKEKAEYDLISMGGQTEDTQNAETFTFEVADVDVPVDEWLAELRCAAVNALYLSRKGSLNTVWAFASAFRSLEYEHGADYKIFKKCEKVGKRKSLSTQLGDLENDLNEVKTRSEKKDSKAVKAGRKSDSSRSKRPAKETTEKLGSSPQTAAAFSMEAVHAIRQKLDFMTAFLENHLHELSPDDKSSLQGEVKQLLVNVETVSEKLTTMAENASS